MPKIKLRAPKRFYLLRQNAENIYESEDGTFRPNEKSVLKKEDCLLNNCRENLFVAQAQKMCNTRVLNMRKNIVKNFIKFTASKIPEISKRFFYFPEKSHSAGKLKGRPSKFGKRFFSSEKCLKKVKAVPFDQMIFQKK